MRLKEIIDAELYTMKMNDTMKESVKRNVLKSKPKRVYRLAAASLAILLLGGTTVFAGQYLINQVNINVNDEILPELDEMQRKEMNVMDIADDEYGMQQGYFTDYDVMKEEMGIALLDTELSEDNPYMQGTIFGDKKDFYSLNIENFILGDTSDYQYLPEENRYTYKKGAEYCSPVSLGVSIILSESQLKKGWNVDYLGMYEFVEQFESEQGYKVNLIQSAGGEAKMLEGYLCRKCAVFVADGIYYTLTGQVSIEKMKEIVNTMKVE